MRVLLEFDKVFAEWVVVAYLSGDANMIAVLESGADPHVRTGELITGVPPALITREAKLLGTTTDPTIIEETRRAKLPDLFEGGYFLPRSLTIRQAGKHSNHGLNYDEGYRTFSLMYEIDESEAKRVVSLYKTVAYPNIPIWHEDIRAKLRRDRTLVNLLGRKCRFLDAWGQDLFKAAYSFIPQSTVFDVVRDGMISLYQSEDRDLAPLDLLAQTHDSATYQYEIKGKNWLPIARAAIACVETHFNPLLRARGRDFRIKTDMKIGLSWGRMGKVELVKDPKKTALAMQEALERTLEEKRAEALQETRRLA